MVVFVSAAMLAVKFRLYPGWTWKGFLDDFASASKVAGLFVPVAIVLWTAYRNKGPQESLIDVLRRKIGLRVTVMTAIPLAGCGLSIIAAMCYLGEAGPPSLLLHYVADHNWEASRELFAKLQKQPLRPEVESTLLTYVSVYQAASEERLRQSLSFRDLRRQAEELLNDGYDPLGLNTLAFAEASRCMYLVEAAPELLREATLRLESALQRTKRDDEKAIFLAKLGHLSLSGKQYVEAQKHLSAALSLEVDRTRKASILADIASALASTGQLQAAIAMQRTAEGSYPTGRKHVYYSNLAYMLKLAGEYQEAEAQARRAVSIKQDDWISHMNLGLIHDAQGRYPEAQSDYQRVVSTTDIPAMKTEALILQGQSAQRAGRRFAEYAGLYLTALGRDASTTTIGAFASDRAKLRELYGALAVRLGESPAHGLDTYIDWLKQQAEKTDTR